jgi:transposase-like protein
VKNISKSQVSEIASALDADVASFRGRPLDGGPYRLLSLDALALKVREEGRIVSAAALIAIGVNREGHREILGLDVVTAEDGTAWTSFLRDLVARGLVGVVLVTSDAHEGLKAAIAAVLPGAAWQRCRTHFARNLLAKVPKSAQDFVAAMNRSIFAQADRDTVWAQHRRVADDLRTRFPQAAALLDAAREACWPSPVSPLTTGGRFGRPTRRSASTVSCAGDRTSSGSSPTAPRSCGSSARCWPSSTTSGRS